MGMRIDVLDHGYVQFCEAWGHGGDESRDLEAGVIAAARQSTQGSFRGWDQDARLLNYLYEHKHATPFEFAGMVIEVQAPLFVFREWHRHRTQSYNEMSARYAPLPDLYYRPDADHVHARADAAYAAANKQQASQQPPGHASIDSWLQEGDWLYERLEQHYQRGLMIGVPKELARIRMPVGHYSRMRASANLRNWLAFLTLRMDPAAQWEIRQFAESVGQIVAQQFPRTWALFEAGGQ
jgi:thymidylate synthase (FAD)